MLSHNTPVARWRRLLLKLEGKKIFYYEAVNQFNETARFYRERFTTKSKKAKD